MLVKFGPGIVDARGSIAGVTFSRNRSGAYARARVKPVNPNTERQDLIRSTLAMLNSRWSQTVTQVQRTGWNLYGASVTMKNGLGEAIHLSGQNHYIRSNTIIASRGPWIVDEPPVIFELPEQDPTLSVSGSEATQDLTVGFDDTLDWANEDPGWLLMFQGSPQNPQRESFFGPWRFLSNLVGILGGGVVEPHVAPAVFAISEGQKQTIYARIMRVDGRLSEPFRAECLIGA